MSATVVSHERRFDRRILVRVLGVLAGLAVYYAFDWVPLQVAWHRAFALGLAAIGDPVQTVGRGSALLLLVDGKTFALTPNCTYLDLSLVLTPLLWRPGRRVGWNLGQLLAKGAVVATLNLLRVVGAIHLTVASGLGWHAVHFWSDLTIHVGMITAAALWALRTDWQESVVDPQRSGRGAGLDRGLASEAR